MEIQGLEVQRGEPEKNSKRSLLMIWLIKFMIQESKCLHVPQKIDNFIPKWRNKKIPKSIGMKWDEDSISGFWYASCGENEEPPPWRVILKAQPSSWWKRLCGKEGIHGSSFDWYLIDLEECRQYFFLYVWVQWKWSLSFQISCNIVKVKYVFTYFRKHTEHILMVLLNW